VLVAYLGLHACVACAQIPTEGEGSWYKLKTRSCDQTQTCWTLVAQPVILATWEAEIRRIVLSLA
jgi:hypothetical protein